MGIGKQILDEARGQRTPPFTEKLIGKDVRVRWGGIGWTRDGMWIEEMPGKPVKRKVRHTTVDTTWFTNQHLDRFLMSNLVMDAKLNKSMNYEQVLKAMKDAVEGAAKAYEGKPAGRITRPFEFDRYGGMGGIFHEKTIGYLEVEPENFEPIKAKLKDDVTLTAHWNEFIAYSPSYRPEMMDRPHFISSKSPGGARKLYKILKADPDALKTVGYTDMGRFLSKHKIAYTWV